MPCDFKQPKPDTDLRLQQAAGKLRMLKCSRMLNAQDQAMQHCSTRTQHVIRREGRMAPLRR